jgi:hypothetical protein
MEMVLEKLSQREKQVINLTEENSSLQETIRALQAQLEGSPSPGAVVDQDLVKEKDVLAQKLRTSKAEFDGILKQKDAELQELKDTLQGLYAEGLDKPLIGTKRAPGLSFLIVIVK